MTSEPYTNHLLKWGLRMSETILVKVDKFGHMNVGELSLAKKESSAHSFIHFYTGVSWALFENDTYDEDIAKEFPNEFHSAKASVPKYRMFKNGIKIGYVFPRETESGWRYLLIVTEKRNEKTMRKRSIHYYIKKGFDRDYNIIMPTTIMRNVKSNAF